MNTYDPRLSVSGEQTIHDLTAPLQQSIAIVRERDRYKAALLKLDKLLESEGYDIAPWDVERIVTDALKEQP